ncbi:MAG: hypothetical protein AMJ54_03995 [Deltaproteobacteria bacterium SG8_13]|nr:MAG: hypothetical protein AMJ54_03995 [Deltaproteobacteria bacterium SG8_13]
MFKGQTTGSRFTGFFQVTVVSKLTLFAIFSPNANRLRGSCFDQRPPLLRRLLVRLPPIACHGSTAAGSRAPKYRRALI